jgi:hypothetical protein
VGSQAVVGVDGLEGESSGKIGEPRAVVAVASKCGPSGCNWAGHTVVAVQGWTMQL